jgi:tryptophanase
MFGAHPDGSETPAAMDLVRLAIPRRTYTQSHADYIIEVFEELVEIKDSLKGFRISRQPKLMRHFTCNFERL